MKMTTVTAWYRLDRAKLGGGFFFNHIEDGHAAGDKPKDPFNRGWSGATWLKRKAYLYDPSRTLVLMPLGGTAVVPISEPKKVNQ